MRTTSYKLIHADARLSGKQKADIQNWVAVTRKELENKYPADSLKKPKK